MGATVKKIGIGAAVIVGIPVIVFLLFFAVCTAASVSNFASASNITIILRTTVYSGLIALAFSLNLSSGRFDFSIGSVLILSTIIATQMTVNLGFGPAGMLVLFLLSGLIIGTVSGLIYVLIRIPTMVCSIGVAMLFEAVGYMITGGSGVKVIGRMDILIWASQPYVSIIGVCMVALLVFLSSYTKFGYDYAGLRSGQAVAVMAGIREKKNAVLCYSLAGMLLACAGMINLSITGTCMPATGLSSSSYMMNAFLPMFIGTAVERFVNRNIGVMMGTLVQSIITVSFGRLGLTTSLQNLCNAVIILGFLFVQANSYLVGERKMFRKKYESAQDSLRQTDYIDS